MNTNNKQKGATDIIITVDLVTRLIQEQFPELAHLPINHVLFNGHDNRTFRLGDNMLVRLPSAEGYAVQVPKEQKWLPKFATHLSFKIPKPIAQGNPTRYYPWHWSIYEWIEGESANSTNSSNLDMARIATQLAKFLNELHTIDTKDGPKPGLHNYHRGGNLEVYNEQTQASIAELQDIIDSQIATAVWTDALSTKWTKAPKWVHGNFASGNILIKYGLVNSIIDFGCMCIGDPACDLVIAWTFLDNESRKIFKEHLSLDKNTWARTRGWALWKATFELVQLQDKTSEDAIAKLKIINEILQEYESLRRCLTFI